MKRGLHVLLCGFGILSAAKTETVPALHYDLTGQAGVHEGGVGRCWETLLRLWRCVRSSVGVVAIVVCVAVFFTDLSTARRWGVFSAGRVGGYPPLLAVADAALKQA